MSASATRDATAAGGPALSIFLIAGEPSGDALGGRLMAALRRQTDGAVHFAGVGGEAMAAEGLNSLFPVADIALMGFVEVLPHLPRVLRRIRQTADAIRAARPDVLVTIDAPGFSLRVARRVAGHGIPLVHYVAPSVWAWRPGRAARIARYLDLLLALLPFEPPYFERHGLRCVHVGHPVTEIVPQTADGRAFRMRHGIAAEAPLLIALPGSRLGEVRRHLPVFGAAVERLARDIAGLRVAVPTVPAVRDAVAAAARRWHAPAIVVDGTGEKLAAFAAGNAALAASGTVTLELAAFGLPTVVAYRANPVTAAIVRRLARVRHASLVNILADRAVEPEFLQENCRAGVLAAAVTELLCVPAAAAAQRAAFREIMQRLAVALPPSECAAAAILGLIGARTAPAIGDG